MDFKESCRSWQKLKFQSWITRNWYMSVLWKLVIPLIRYESFRPWENEKGKLFPFNFGPKFSSWAASATSTFFKKSSSRFLFREIWILISFVENIFRAAHTCRYLKCKFVIFVNVNCRHSITTNIIRSTKTSLYSFSF